MALMATNQVTISGVLYDGSGANTAPDNIVFGIQNTTPPPKEIILITTSTTTTIPVPAGAKACQISCNLSAGTVTCGGQPLGAISNSVIDFETASGGNIVIVTTGITGTVQVRFI